MKAKFSQERYQRGIEDVSRNENFTPFPRVSKDNELILLSRSLGTREQDRRVLLIYRGGKSGRSEIQSLIVTRTGII